MKVTYLSKIFIPAIQKLPKDSKINSKSQKLLVYYGLISPSGIGTFNIMPIFQRSLDKLIKVVNNHMTHADAEKITMPSLGQASLWKASGRWGSLGSEMFRLVDKDNKDLCLQPTHEEEVTNLLASFSSITSQQLPILLYQIGPKFRNEIAPKSGLLRAREFIMKDLYSFDRDSDSAIITYNRIVNQYHRLFQDLDLKYMCVEADCGAMGGILSHEFHMESKVGEDVVLRCDSCGKGFNEELQNKINLHSDLSCPNTACQGTLSRDNAIEIGHCFLLGEKYSKVFDLHYITNNNKKFVMMGCYGIGITRLLSTCVEVLSNENEIRWPRKIAPFKVAVLLQKDGAHDQPSTELTNLVIEGLRGNFQLSGLCPSDIVVDDRQCTIGKKLSYASCIGIPWAIVVKNKDTLETVDVYNKVTKYFSLQECIDIVSGEVRESRSDDSVTLP